MYFKAYFSKCNIFHEGMSSILIICGPVPWINTKIVKAWGWRLDDSCCNIVVSRKELALELVTESYRKKIHRWGFGLWCWNNSAEATLQETLMDRQT